MTSRMNLSQLGQMVRNPELPFSLDAIERAMLAGLNQFFTDPSSKILAVRQTFDSIRESGQEVHDQVVRAMEEALGIGSDEISEEQAARMREEAVLPCARVSRE